MNEEDAFWQRLAGSVRRQALRPLKHREAEERLAAMPGGPSDRRLVDRVMSFVEAQRRRQHMRVIFALFSRKTVSDHVRGVLLARKGGLVVGGPPRITSQGH